MTKTDDRLIAASAIVGDRKVPINDYRTPAAIGIPASLYPGAKNRFSLMSRSIAFANLRGRTIPISSPPKSLIRLPSIAPSVPVPMAMPKSAA